MKKLRDAGLFTESSDVSIIIVTSWSKYLLVKAYWNFNSLCVNPRKWSITLKQFISKLPMNCLSVFDHFVGLLFKGLTQIWVGQGVILPLCWFSLNNSETLAFCSIQLHLIRDVCAKFGIPYSPQSPDIEQNSDEGISDFRISGQSLIKRNCRNSWTNDDINMKLGPVIKLDIRNKKCQKNWWWCHVRKLWRDC